MKLGLSVLCAIVVASSATTALQAKPKAPSTGSIELSVDEFTSKTKTKKGITSLNNVTVYVNNVGDTDAKKARIEWYVSDDDILTTATDNPTTPPDTLIHSQALGNVKAGKAKKRTLGGGHLKGLTPGTGQYLFVLVDSTYVIDEENELDNILSTPLP